MDNPTNQADANMEASAPSLGSKFFKFMKIFVLGVCVFLYDIYSKIYYKTKYGKVKDNLYVILCNTNDLNDLNNHYRRHAGGNGPHP